MHRIERAGVICIRQEPDLERIPPDEKVRGWRLVAAWFLTWACGVGLVAATALIIAALVRAAIRFPYWKWMVR